MDRTTAFTVRKLRDGSATLLHDGNPVDNFADEHQAAYMAVCFAQDNGLVPYTVEYITSTGVLA